MKQTNYFCLLLISLVICGFQVCAQHTYTDTSDATISWGKPYLGNFSDFNKMFSLRHYDTIEVIMEIIDTSEQHLVPAWDGQWLSTLKPIFIMGYVVYNIGHDVIYNSNYRRSVAAYLYDNKLPLNKNYIVWQIKELY